jgi:hypothetical protein
VTLSDGLGVSKREENKIVRRGDCRSIMEDQMWVSRRHLSRLCVRGHLGHLSLPRSLSLQVSRRRVPVTNSENMRTFASSKNNKMLVRTLHSVKQMKFMVLCRLDVQFDSGFLYLCSGAAG